MSPSKSFQQVQVWILILVVTLTFQSLQAQDNPSMPNLQEEDQPIFEQNIDKGVQPDEELPYEKIPLDVGDDSVSEIAKEVSDTETENPMNISENSNETILVNGTSLNETKPVRTIAYCALPQMLQLDSDPILMNTESNSPVLVNGSDESEEIQGKTAEINVENGYEIPAPDNENVSEADVPLDSENPSAEQVKSSLRLVNMTELVQDILWSNTSIKSRIIPANCSIVLFYASWCPFSAKAAPHFNALPRAFPALRVAAIDVSLQSSVNSYFGILSVPTVILYHNGRSIAKFNESSFSLHKFAEFIQSHTDLRSDENINVTSQDFAGPVPSAVTKGMDIYLLFAWIFIAACFFHYVTKSALWRRTIDLVRTTWREAEDHVHQD